MPPHSFHRVDSFVDVSPGLAKAIATLRDASRPSCSMRIRPSLLFSVDRQLYVRLPGNDETQKAVDYIRRQRVLSKVSLTIVMAVSDDCCNAIGTSRSCREEDARRSYSVYFRNKRCSSSRPFLLTGRTCNVARRMCMAAELVFCVLGSMLPSRRLLEYVYLDQPHCKAVRASHRPVR